MAGPAVFSNYYGSGGKDKASALAWAVMAGTSYRFTQFTSLDVGYRLLHLDGTTFTFPYNGPNAARLTIPDQFNHEIRVGVRFDVN